ncbi:MAG: LysR substrate-binding domain-containing protein [Burkholderiaceae bacterium]
MKLPPLNAVRAFDAAARHQNLRHAAADLFVTPGAVSQQIRQLEDWLGVRLFERQPRGLALTEAGQLFHAAVSRALRTIAQAAERVRPDHNTVTISVLPTIAARWLMPRLDSFTRRYPLVDVRVDANIALAQFDGDGVDLAIRHAADPPAGLASRRLCRESMYPVCSPVYRDAHVRDGRLQSDVRLLHEIWPRASGEYWLRWLDEQDYQDIDAARGLYFSHEMLAADAAARGQGVALTNQLLTADAVARDELVVAVPQPLLTGKSYLLVWPDRPLRESVRCFRDWLIEAFAEAVDAAERVLGAPR